MRPISFDDYCRAVRQASVQFVLTQRAMEPWCLHFAQYQSTAVQFGSDGGASIADGVVSETNYILIGRHRPSPANINLNGERLDPQDFALLPPGGRFIFASDGPRTWFAVTIPRSIVDGIWLSNERLRLRISNKKACIVPVDVETARTLVSQAERFLHLSNAPADPNEMIEAESHLVGTARSIISQDCIAARASLEHLKANEIVGTAIASLSQPEFFETWYVEDLARAAQVHPRTLLRAFHRVVGMGPVKYLRFRQLNDIRRELCAAGDHGRTVTEVLHGLGASDMGRVSGAYKSLFGETPSETLRTAIRSAGMQSAAAE
jgi:AraC family ethanolamine operon transcriptional activator